MSRTPGRRSLWLTVPLYVVLLGIITLDVWAAGFWARVGGSVGWAVVAIVSVGALVLALLGVIDARRQWLLGRAADSRHSRVGL